MATRNFWVQGRVDGRQTWVEGGPARKDGGMWLVLTQRDNGSIVRAVEVDCRVLGDGALRTIVYDGQGNEVCRLVTRR